MILHDSGVVVEVLQHCPARLAQGVLVPNVLGYPVFQGLEVMQKVIVVMLETEANRLYVENVVNTRWRVPTWFES